VGLTVGVGVPILVAMVISNLPEGMVGTVTMEGAGMPRRTIVGMWLALMLVSAVAAALGYALVKREVGVAIRGAGTSVWASPLSSAAHTASVSLARTASSRSFSPYSQYG
jgi:ZIP family zinc transporter